MAVQRQRNRVRKTRRDTEVDRKPRLCLTALPAELHLQIIATLDFKSVRALSYSSKYFHQLIDWSIMLHADLRDMRAELDEIKQSKSKIDYD